MAILGRPFAIRALFLAPFPYDHLRSRAKKHNTLPARHANCADGQEWPGMAILPSSAYASMGLLQIKPHRTMIRA